ncbi:hypothetical protein [Paenibacillus sp. FSL H8-0079]|uniref:hypothetical protein n=1 Tax=Paenibacillus sp. FSL H8-0079 TaxID=2921375 RepID=UPI0030EE7E11
MNKSLPIKKVTTKLGSRDVTTMILKQKEINIIVKEEQGHLLIIDTADSHEMFLLASLFDYSMKSGDVIYLAREDPKATNLFIFNGAINPLAKKELKKIRLSMKFSKSEIYHLPLLDTYDETIWDTWEHWKYDEQLRVKADQDIAIINSTKLGFEMLVHSCLFLATSDSGHSHFDYYSTKSSPELMIRNIARN